MTRIAANRGRCPTAATRGSVVRLLGMSLCSALILTACKPPSSESTKETGTPAYVDVINYNHDHNFGYSVVDRTVSDGQTISGGAVWPLASGGSVNCCIQLPDAWRPGLKLLLTWDDYIKHDLQGHFERELEIPAYQSPGNLYVVFGPDRQPELIVSRVEPGHPDWPGKIRQTPWEYCVAQHGRKPCKAALPKRFDSVSAKGFCTWAQEQKSPEALTNCSASMYLCVNEYEDEAFCKKTLWGAYAK
ncbi:DUF3304 domain-containing protein [Uliginosibacterium paludis]|uniref:DUF3304 domain-containing protein n=1 Tax=Uliginosibacterium paludis TaxID=1615952 RepID=A0ABV2CRX9_9RHOO